MVNGQRWRTRFANLAADRLLVDIGTSSLTGLRATTLEAASHPPLMAAHPVYETLPLNAGECAAIGSDFQRVGPLFPRPVGDEDTDFVDTYGVKWLWADGSPAPYEHPLEHADWLEIPKHPRAVLPDTMQLAETQGASLIVADAPCPGLLDTCFALRNGWQFLDDITGNWRIATALLDWSLETTARAYEHMLEALPVQPDVVVYGDDLGFQGGMYLSDTDFRNFLHPRLKTLISRIRAKTDAAICLHSCGGVKSILGDLADLGIEMLNLDFYAKGMDLEAVRRVLPKALILHAPVDLIALGAAARRKERAAVAQFAMQLSMAGASIHGPPDNISERHFVQDAIAGAAVVHALNKDDLKRLRDVGPERSIIDRMIAAAGTNLLAYAGNHPRVATVHRAHPPSGHVDDATQPAIKANSGQSPGALGA